MRVFVYSTRPYDREYLTTANAAGRHELVFSEAYLAADTAVLAENSQAVCCFVDDDLSRDVLSRLAQVGVRLVLLRATGFNNVDLPAAADLDISVMRVGQYSPYAVAEFALTLMLALNRHVHRAYNRVRESNFLLNGLLGFDLHKKTVGIVGTGKIGAVLVRILNGFECRLLLHDQAENPLCVGPNATYVSLDTLWAESDIISLHLPLTPQTHHLINADVLAKIKPGTMLINTSRGGLVDTAALITALKSGRLGSVGLDVYEEEEHLYFRDLSDQIISDDVFTRLLSFPNVLVTGHQAFFTHEALTDISRTTLENLDDFAAGRRNENTLGLEYIANHKNR